MGPPPGLFAELARWRDKATRRGRDCTFTSDIIPDWLCEQVKTAIELVGVGDAFRFLKASEPTRDQLERRMTRDVGAVLDEFSEEAALAVEAGTHPDYQSLQEGLRLAILPLLIGIATEQAMRVSVSTGVSFDPAVINVRAAQWARSYSYELISGLTETTRNVVSEAISSFIETPGMTLGDIHTMLEPAFGKVRAEMIATTEVTRAYSAATNETQQLLNETGLQMRRVWHTRNDELVCPICGPLNGQPEEHWIAEFPTGPPAHPRCRCDEGLSAFSEEFHRGEAVELAKQREAFLREQGLWPTA